MAAAAPAGFQREASRYRFAVAYLRLIGGFFKVGGADRHPLRHRAVAAIACGEAAGRMAGAGVRAETIGQAWIGGNASGSEKVSAAAFDIRALAPLVGQTYAGYRV